MQPINSSNISGADYYPSKQELHVQFKNGQTYKYMGVPSEVWDEFCAAESKGKYLAESIRPKYASIQLPKTQE